MRGKKLLKNIVSTLFMQIVTITCSFIIPIALIKAYGSNVNGLVTSITKFLAYITLLESGIGPVIKATLYKPIANKNKEEIKCILKAADKFFKVISYIFIGYICVLAIIFPIIMHEQFNIMFTLSLVIIISISTFAEYYFGMVYNLYLQAEQKTYVVSNIQTITTILNSVSVIVLIKFGCNIQIVKLVSALTFTLRPIIQNIYVKKKYNINLKEVKTNYKLEQKWDGLAQHIAAVVHTNTDVVILTLFCNIKEVSVYSVYSLVISGIKRIISSLVAGSDALFGDMIVKKEKEKLNKIFLMYELIYFCIITIIFSCTLLLILPFVNVYTKGVTDVSYYRPIFACIIVLAEFVCVIRSPYIDITYSAGHFKETRKGAWVEALSNIIISIILVIKLGIVGVAIGTLVAMTIRTVEFIYHSSKKILERSVVKPFIRILISGLQMALIVMIFKNCNYAEITTYILWIKYAIIIFITSALIVIPTNAIIYLKDTKEIYNICKKMILKRKEESTT